MLVLCKSSANAKTKSLFTLWKIDSIKWFKFRSCANNSGFDRYLFQLKPDWADKVTTGT